MKWQPTNIWGKVIRLPSSTDVGAFCDIGDPDIGEHCSIQCHVSIPPGWRIGSNVFIGPGVHFANDRKPKVGEPFSPKGGRVEDGASIGMGALIMPVTIGAGAMIGAGAVVTKDVPPGETWVGNPARPISSTQ